MIDPELITRKMALILQDVPALTDLSRKSREEYLSDPIHEVLAERYIERIVGRMIDINFHLITEQDEAPPRDYHDPFVRLGSLGILPGEFAREIAYCAGLRNRIAHDYDEIDAGRVYETLAAAVRHIPAYLDHIQRFIEKQARE
jgi:uncharacterized protein YutE (UPF0331/DUF86 family)